VPNNLRGLVGEVPWQINDLGSRTVFSSQNSKAFLSALCLNEIV
jgi:hypothetical protein